MVVSERVSYQSFSSQRHVGSIAGLEREGYEEFNINALQCNASLGGGGFWKVFRAVNGILAAQQVLSGGGGGIWEFNIDAMQHDPTWPVDNVEECDGPSVPQCNTARCNSRECVDVRRAPDVSNTVQRNDLLKFQKNWLHYKPTMHFNSGQFIAMMTVLAIRCKH